MEDDIQYFFFFIIIGDPATGKSSLLKTLTDNEFTENYTQTIGVDFRVHTIFIHPKQKVTIQIWDLTSNELFEVIANSYYKCAHAIILTYSSTDLSSFRSLSCYLSQITEKCRKDVQILLLETKSDLVSDRQIQLEEAKQFADENGLRFISTSSKTQKVKELFKLFVSLEY